MQITSMKCNQINNPLGYELGVPRLSWITIDDTATKQLAAQVIIAADLEFEHIVFDSGEDQSIDSIAFPPPIKLLPKTRYYWKVNVWTDANHVIESPVAWFETAKLQEPWDAQWIGPANHANEHHPVLKKIFKVEQPIAKARLYTSGLGLYEAYLNGQRIGDEYLAPYCNNYFSFVQYQTYDVTDYISVGDNNLGAMLGNGWYKGRFGFDPTFADFAKDKKFAYIAELVINYQDGSSETIITDQSWQAFTSFITDSSIYDGEHQDANLITSYWSNDTLDGQWSQAQLIDIDDQLLQARRSLPVKIMEVIKPQSIITTPNQEIVLDFGQNMVGWVSFLDNNPQGSSITLSYGEELQHGNFYNENYRTAKSEFKYISNGKQQVVRPYFTFFGFRYVRVEGWVGELTADHFTGNVLYSELETTGHIETSNDKVNRLFLNALWGQKGNFLDVPTDCPQRDERMGWTGDAQMFSGTACFNMNSDAFFRKYLYDLATEQKRFGGKVPFFVPTFISDAHLESDRPSAGSSAWSEAATVIPWNMYLHYGDASILREQYQSMVDYIESIRAQDDGDRLWDSGFHFGDWLALDGAKEFDVFGGTPTDLISTAYYAYSSEIVAKSAEILGYTEQAAQYNQLSQEVKNAFTKKFVNEDGYIEANTQTSYIVALFMNLVPEAMKPRLVQHLVALLEQNNYYLKTGFVGTPYLCRVLSDYGHNDIAYKLLLNEQFPSWMYAINLGATTIWERWNSLLPDGTFGELGMNSLNHYTYGSIVEWMYRHMLGINPMEEAPGFRKIILKPQPNQALQHAKTSIKTVNGTIESSWKYTDSGIQYSFTIPFNCEAQLILEYNNQTSIMYNEKTIKLVSESIEDKQMSYALVSGTYTFTQFSTIFS